MTRALAIALVVAGCAKRERAQPAAAADAATAAPARPDARPATVVTAPDAGREPWTVVAEPVVLAPPPSGTPPPPAPGRLRIDRLDVDVEVAPGATATVDGDVVVVSWPHPSGGEACEMRLGMAMVLGATMVGTLPVMCSSSAPPECGLTCGAMTPVPGSTADEPYPTSLPVIEVRRVERRATVEHVAVWRDGTVMYAGPLCPEVRGRRGTLPAAEVDWILGGIEGAGFFDYQMPITTGSLDLPDCPRIVITAERKGVVDVEMYRTCDEVIPSELLKTFHVLSTRLGPNPCAR